LNPHYEGKMVSIDQAMDSARIAQERFKEALIKDIRRDLEDAMCYRLDIDGKSDEEEVNLMLSDMIDSVEVLLDSYESDVEGVFESFLESDTILNDIDNTIKEREGVSGVINL